MPGDDGKRPSWATRDLQRPAIYYDRHASRALHAANGPPQHLHPVVPPRR